MKFASGLSFYNVIKHNTNDYMVSEQIEYTAFLAAMSAANILIQKWNEQIAISLIRELF